MSSEQRRTARDVIWQAMVEHAEALHDQVVDTQAHPRARDAQEIFLRADELSALARTATLIMRRRSA